jgi:hypothetical protein
MFKVNVNFFISALANLFISAKQKPFRNPRVFGRPGTVAPTVWFCFDFDFNILTAFIRLGRARPVRGGGPSILFDFDFDFLLFIIFK